MSHQDYLAVNSLADAMLDTLAWSGGNATLDALAMGLPVVTLPGEFMRGRQSLAMLHMLDLPELIAADTDAYVSAAVLLASSVSHRQSMRAKILARADRLFDDPAPIVALQAALVSLVEAPAAAAA